MGKDLDQELQRIKLLGVSAWYYPGEKVALEGNAVEDIDYLLKVIAELRETTQRLRVRNEKLKEALNTL